MEDEDRSVGGPTVVPAGVPVRNPLDPSAFPEGRVPTANVRPQWAPADKWSQNKGDHVWLQAEALIEKAMNEHMSAPDLVDLIHGFYDAEHRKTPTQVPFMDKASIYSHIFSTPPRQCDLAVQLIWNQVEFLRLHQCQQDDEGRVTPDLANMKAMRDAVLAHSRLAGSLKKGPR
jgi:hypothetical protein